MHDYLLTNTAGKIEERIAQGAAHIRSRSGAEIHDDAIRALMSVNPIYLDAALATVRRDHGDIPTYAAAVLNFTPEMREALVDRLEIGRASCRERVCQYGYISVFAVYIKQKNKKS